MIRLVPFIAVVFLACPGETKREICGDGIDNDGNGQTDCDDRDCTGQAACIPPDYGNCAKCSHYNRMGRDILLPKLNRTEVALFDFNPKRNVL